MKSAIQWLGHLLAVITGSIGVAVVWLSNDPFLLSGGSDAPNLILGPPAHGWIGAAIVIFLLPPLLVIRRSSFPTGAGWAVLWLLILALASHRVVVDGVHGEIRDVWALLPVQRLDIQGADGPAATIRRQQGAYVVLGTTDGTGSIFVLKGIPPLAIDFSPIGPR